MKNLTSKLVAGIMAVTPIVYTGCGVEPYQKIDNGLRSIGLSAIENNPVYTENNFATKQTEIYSKNGISVTVEGDCDCLEELTKNFEKSYSSNNQSRSINKHEENSRKRASYLEKGHTSKIKTSPGSSIDSIDCATKGDLSLDHIKEYCSITIGDKDYLFKKDTNSYYGFSFSTVEKSKTSINLGTQELSKEVPAWFHPSMINQDSIRYEPTGYQKRNLRRMKSKEKNGKTTNTEIINANFKTLEIPEVGEFIILGSQSSGEPILIPLNKDTNFDLFSKDVYYFKNQVDHFAKLRTK